MYADLHCHASAKPFLSAIEPENKISPWPAYSGSVPQMFYPIIGSQSSLKQLQDGQVNLAVISIVPFEKALANFWMIRDLVTTFTILDRPTLQQINKGKISYNRLFWQEVDYLFKYRKHENMRLNILRSIEDYDKAENVINSLISIEGSHLLFNENNQADEPLKQLIKIKQEEAFNIFYLTMTHLSRNEYCNHAQGMKISKDKIFNPSLQTKGLDERGLAIIRECYDRTNGPRILIDIKHMSLYARLQFYKFRREQGYGDIPIIASHMGLTGLSYSSLESKKKWDLPNQKLVQLNYDTSTSEDLTFNPLSINLYDEEVLEIINSGGLLGLSLDQRILGRVGKKVSESIRQDELEELTRIEKNGVPKLKREKISAGDKNKIGLRHLCMHILHIIQLTGIKGWKHICLGTDFDGLIDPIDSCKTASELPELEKLLLAELRKIIESTSVEIPVQDLALHVRDFMFNNLNNFTRKYFTRQYLLG